MRLTEEKIFRIAERLHDELEARELLFYKDPVGVHPQIARTQRIKAIVDTKFDRTDSGLFKTPAFAEKVDEIWNLVKAEAIKAQEARVPA